MVDLDQNKNNIFFVNRSEITDRLDPLMAQYNKGLRSFNYDLVSLKSLLLQAPQYGANESGVERKKAEEVRYIRITDIDENGLLKQDSLGATAINIEDRFILQKDDIVFARSGNTVGKAYIHKGVEKSIFAGYMIRYVVDRRKVLPDFIFTYTQLKPYKDWVRSVQRAAGQPNINAEEYKSLQIPLPPFDVQTVIVDKINNAYNHKQQKDAEAKSLLDGIDDYLLEELGIAAYKGDDNLNSRVFITSMSNISGDKWAPYWTRNKSRKVGTGIYPNISLKEIARISKGQSITKNSIVNGNYPVIAGGQTSPYNHNVCNTGGESITVSASGAYSGYVWYHNYPIFASDCTVLETFDKTVISTLYLFEVLKLKQNEIYMLQQGAGQPHVYPQDLARIKIPIPDINIQNAIVNHISEIRAKAKQLQQEGEAILSAAKAEVERMILG